MKLSEFIKDEEARAAAGLNKVALCVLTEIEDKLLDFAIGADEKVVVFSKKLTAALDAFDEAIKEEKATIHAAAAGQIAVTPPSAPEAPEQAQQ